MLLHVSALHYSLLSNNIPCETMPYVFILCYSMVELCHGYLGFLYFFSFINNAAVNTHIQVVVWIYVFICLGHILRSRTDTSYGNSNI